MQNYFDAWLYESDGAGSWQKAAFASSAFSVVRDVLLFLTYPPTSWHVIEDYEQLDTPLVAPQWTIHNPNGGYLRYDLGGAGIITPAEIPTIGNQCHGPTVTNAVTVRGFHGTVTIPARTFTLAAGAVDYNLRMYGVGPGATFQNPLMAAGRDANGINIPVILEETEYTAAMQTAGNLIVDGATILHIVGLWE